MARILIVDDDPDIVAAMRMFLETDGHEVTSAGTREAGMKAITEDPPDLLILDVMLEDPDDGMVMARELRDLSFDKPILMLTSIGKVTGMSFGRDDEFVPVDEYQEKPIEPATLIAKVNELLGKQGDGSDDLD